MLDRFAVRPLKKARTYQWASLVGDTTTATSKSERELLTSFAGRIDIDRNRRRDRRGALVEHGKEWLTWFWDCASKMTFLAAEHKISDKIMKRPTIRSQAVREACNLRKGRVLQLSKPRALQAGIKACGIHDTAADLKLTARWRAIDTCRQLGR